MQSCAFFRLKFNIFEAYTRDRSFAIVPGEGEAVAIGASFKRLIVANDFVQRYAELNRRTTTDSGGRYLFRNLPAGDFTIRINEQQYGHVSISAGPQVVRQDIKLSPDALASAQRYRCNQ